MSSNFEWHTEDKWDQFEQSAEPPEPPRRNRWVWLVGALIGAAMLVVGGVYVTRNVTERAEEVTAFTEENVRSSFRLIERAAANNDLELFNSMLSGRNEAWTAALQRLFIEGAVFDRSALGLTMAEDPSTITSVELSPELRSAELTAAIPFVIDVGNGVTATTSLEQTFIFRRGSNNFIFAPAEESFWGDPQALESDRLKLSYRSADAEIATDLFNDLDTLILQFCESFIDPTCGNRLPLNITLSVDPSTLVDIRSLEAFLASNRFAYALPSPTIIGQPTNELGYDAILSAYMSQIVAGVMADVVDYDCCANVAYFQGIVDQQMVALGLQPPTLSAEAFRALLDADLPLEENSQIWALTSARDITPEQERLVAATLAYFLDRDPTLTLRELLSALQTAEAGFASWQRQVLPPDARSGRFDPFGAGEVDAWRRFVISRTGLDGDALAPDIPDGTMLVACSADSASTLYALSPATPAWTSLLRSDYANMGVVALQEPGAALLYEISSQPRWRISVWQDGAFTALNTGSGQPGEQFWAFGGTDGDTLVVTPYSFDAGQGSTQEPEAEAAQSLLNWQACAQGACDLVQVGGVPLWNQGHTHGVVATESGVRVVDRSGRTVRDIPDSLQPVLGAWTNDDTLVYATRAHNLIAWDWSEKLPLFTIGAAELAARVLPDRTSEAWQISGLFALPDGSEDLLVLLDAPDTRHTVVMRYSTQSPDDVPTLLLERDAGLSTAEEPFWPGASGAFSADNRHIILVEDPVDNSRLNAIILNTQDGGARSVNVSFQAQWVGDWVADRDSGFLRLQRPDGAEQRFIPLPEPNCATFAWISGAQS